MQQTYGVPVEEISARHQARRAQGQRRHRQSYGHHRCHPQGVGRDARASTSAPFSSRPARRSPPNASSATRPSAAPAWPTRSSRFRATKWRRATAPANSPPDRSDPETQRSDGHGTPVALAAGVFALPRWLWGTAECVQSAQTVPKSPESGALPWQRHRKRFNGAEILIIFLRAHCSERRSGQSMHHNSSLSHSGAGTDRHCRGGGMGPCRPAPHPHQRAPAR